MRRVCVLGHRGMLGHVVVRHLEELGFDVATIHRRFSDANEIESFVREVDRLAPDWCINCIGVRSGPNVSDEWVDTVNHRLPAACSRFLNPHCGFVHASSDAVFSSMAGDCHWDREMDAMDVYGRSKREAELALKRTNDVVVRCSIVGPEQGTTKSLMDWFRSQEGVVRGFTNHDWNGVTTLQWAKECAARITDGNRKDRILQLASEPVVTKAELLRLIADRWEVNCEIQESEGAEPVHRPLIPNREPVSMRLLLAELQAWY